MSKIAWKILPCCILILNSKRKVKQSWKLPFLLNCICLLKPLLDEKLHLDHTAGEKHPPPTHTQSTKPGAFHPKLKWSFKGWPLDTHWQVTEHTEVKAAAIYYIANVILSGFVSF